MTAKSFQVGEVVSLKSSDRSMVVERVDYDQVFCVWHGKELVRRGSFPAACLRLSDGSFDGVGQLIIEGVTHSRSEIEMILKAEGNA